MITVQLKGGLGNQLFQLFAAISYAMRTKQPFIFSYSELIPGETPRPMYWDTLLQCLKRFTNYDGLIPNSLLDAFYLYKGEHGYAEIPYFEENTRIEGFFQSYKYFEKEYTGIYELLDIDRFKREFTITNHSRDSSTISLHFRIGDYNNKRCYHPVLPLIYYIRSLQYIIQHYPDAAHSRVIVFYEQNDMAIVSENINQLRSMFSSLSFELVQDMCDWKQMIYMSTCTHHIIANSTFSWWGATFATSTVGHNSVPGKIVCYPSIWYGHQLYYINTTDLFHPNWAKIPFFSHEMDMSHCKCFSN
jgi:hypothetical protein